MNKSQPHRPPQDRNAIENADVAVAEALSGASESLPVKIMEPLSEASDQPPLIALSCVVMSAGLIGHDRRLARAGARMLASHLLATAIKTVVKKVVVRTRPYVLVDDGRYERGVGDKDDHPHSSFPSGHTAGAVAVARAFGREYPGGKGAAYTAAGATSLLQIPRCAHYASDVAAGAVVGLIAELAIDRLVEAIDPQAPLMEARFIYLGNDAAV